MTTDQLIRQLGNRLTPSPARMPVLQIAMLWLVMSIAYVVFTMLLIGPFREGASEQLIDHPRFALENAAGFFAIVFWTLGAFVASIPGVSTRWFKRLGSAFLVLWVLDFVVGYVSPALEPSMLGKRQACSLEAYLYSVPPTIAAIWLQARRYPLRPVQSAIHAATAAAMIPAVLMQLACMYAPTHILQHHVLPIAVLALATAAVVYGLRRWPLIRRSVPPSS